jgi:hypothetical protein
MKTMEMEGEHHATFQNEMDSVKIMGESLPLMFTEETVGDSASMESPVRMGRPWKNCIIASKATGEKEKEAQMKKVRMALAPPPNLKALRTKVVSRSNTMRRPDENNVEIYNQRRAKVNTMRKIWMQGDCENKGSERTKARYDCLAGRVTKCGSITQSKLNESHQNSNRRGRTHTG